MFKSKTVLFGIALSLLGFLETLDVTQFAAIIPDNLEPLTYSAVGLVVIVLRLVTSKPVSDK